MGSDGPRVWQQSFRGVGSGPRLDCDRKGFCCVSYLLQQPLLPGNHYLWQMLNPELHSFPLGRLGGAIPSLGSSLSFLDKSDMVACLVASFPKRPGLNRFEDAVFLGTGTFVFQAAPSGQCHLREPSPGRFWGAAYMGWVQ